MNKSKFNIKGLGPKKEDTLIKNGYDTKNRLINADFYDIMHLPGFGFKTTYNIWSELGKEIEYQSMKKITKSNYDNVTIENKVIKSWKEYKKNKPFISGPEEYELQKTTVWSFQERGDWASHTPHYRGNWSPWIVRNVIELYSKPGDIVLDPMVGGGTTPVECKLLGRNSISCDINPGAISITRDRLKMPKFSDDFESTHITYLGDVRNLNIIKDNSIDLIATHPPYTNIIRYGPSVDGDLSQINDYDLFFKEYNKAISEMYRVLKPGAYCAILIGDTHNKSHYVPISHRMMIDYLNHGFELKEDIIKKEWNCESDRYLAKYSGSSFLLTMHEHLFIFRKPKNKNDRHPSSAIEFFK